MSTAFSVKLRNRVILSDGMLCGEKNMPTEQKGSITVFLALILSLLLSLVTASIQSVQAAAARTQILNSADVGLYSLFGQYDRFLLKEYDLFFLDGMQGSAELNLGAVYDNLKSYMTPVLEQNNQKLSVRQGGFTGYRLATDENGEVFYSQAVSYMKATLGSKGVQALLDQYKKKQKETDEAEETGKNAEQENTLQNYESEMDSAAQKSQEAEEAASQGGTAGGGEENGFTDGETKPQVINPIPVIQRIRKMGILDLVLPSSSGISDAEVSGGELLSGREQEKGMLIQSTSEDSSLTSQILFQEYLMEHLGNYRKPSSSGLFYQVEYLLAGKCSDRENLKTVADRLLLIREGINLSCLLADAGKMSQIHALALSVAAGFLIPPAAAVIEAALILCWSFAESVLDVRELFHGGKVPLTKTSADWQLSLENLPYLLENLDGSRRDSENGMSYEDYLQILLLSKSKTEKLKRGMDMIEVEIRGGGRKNFRLDCCIEAIEISIDVKDSKNRNYTVTRQYSYV